MNYICALLLAGIVLCGCSDEGSNTVTYDTKTDTSMKSIDSSAIINDTTLLPRDSTATGVQH